MSIKNLYIIAGCNGAGKTTASFDSHELIAQSNNLKEIDILDKQKFSDLKKQYYGN